MERRITIALIAVLLGVAVVFRLMHLGSVPGINGDEGWWGVQATRWLHDLPYEQTTTSGNPIDKAFLVPLGLLHAVAGPSFAVLRLLPAVANLIALVVGFLLVRRLYGSPTAWVQTVALAIAPTAIAHSRFCQDPSQSILWVSITMYLALLGMKERERWWLYQIAALLVFGMAFWTHPTNLFIAPFLVLPAVPVVMAWIPTSRRGRAIFAAVAAAAAALFVVLTLFVIWPALKSRTGASAMLEKAWLTTAKDHATSGGAWFEYLKNYGRLFSGITVYRYLSGPHLVAFVYGTTTILVTIVVVAGMVLSLRRERSPLDRGLVFGWAAMWLIYFLFAGPESIRPHYERWGLCLIPPVMLLVGRATVAWLAHGARARIVTLACASTIAVALLGAFYLNYFHEFATSGGRSHRTFITASTEPKQEALAQILAQRSGPVMIVAQDWWQYWPIRYLALPDPSITVLMKIPGDNDPDLADALARGHFYFVEFVGSPELAHAREWIAVQHVRITESTVADASGRPLFAVLRLER